MIKHKDIICVGLPNWEGDYMKTIVEIMSVMARHNRVLYVDYEYTFKDVLWGVLKKKNVPVKRVLGAENRLREITLKDNSRLHVLTPPPVLPINWIKSGSTYRSFQKINGAIVQKSIKKAIRKLSFKDPVIINAFNPFFGLPLLNKFGESITAYYCYDEIAAANWCKAHGADLEIEYMKKVDAVITSSEGLFQTKKTWNQNTFLVKNGVNFDLFHQAFTLDKEPKNYHTIGYIGSLDDRLDYELLAHCAHHSPEYQYVFLGRINSEQGRKMLEKYPNVNFLGPKPPHLLPEILKDFSLGIIPFVKNEFTRGIYPLKINEYLAAGIPVVSTDFAVMQDFEEIISLEQTPEAFMKAIHRELQTNSPEKVKERIRVAKSNAWESRAEQLSGILEERLHHISSNN